MDTFNFTKKDDIINYLYGICNMRSDIDAEKMLEDIKAIENGTYKKIITCNICKQVLNRQIDKHGEKDFKCVKCSNFICINCRKRCAICYYLSRKCERVSLGLPHDIECEYCYDSNSSD